ncbi:MULTISPECIES: TRAP transporter small permease [unclassified Halomonas]|uniref:TRAP transporter small permease n=1 Tax=unclassified Halomonas TaxID=2609666 RepID=UPI0040341F36
MTKIIGFYEKVEEFLSSMLLLVVVLLVFFTAIGRWIGLPVAWSVNIAQLLFVWVIFLGASQALRENKHIGVDIITSLLPEKLKRLNELFVLILMLMFLLFSMIYGLKLSVDNSTRVISNTSISYSFITLAVPIGAFLMMCGVVGKIYVLAFRKEKPAGDLQK